MVSSHSFSMTKLLRICIVVAFIACSWVKVAGNPLREGFSSKVGNDARSRMKLDDAGAANGMSREMFLMKDKQWELQPVDFSGIKDAKLRQQCEKFLSKPIKMKLSGRSGSYGFKAQGRLASGKRLRGFWRQLDGREQAGADFLTMPYDEAVRQRLSTVEFEIQLPPTSKKGKKVLPSVIYSVAVEPGAMNPKAVVPRGSGSVRILPGGHGDGGEAETLDLPGKAYVSIPMGAGLVDPSWARGRMVFRKGRPTGPV